MTVACGFSFGSCINWCGCGGKKNGAPCFRSSEQIRGFLFLGSLVIGSRKLLGVGFAQTHHDPVTLYIFNVIRR